MKISFFTSIRSTVFALVSLFVLVVSASVAPVYSASAEEGAVVVSEQLEVNINTANAEAIAAKLTGVGLKKAQAIIAYREQQGAFTSIEQLLAVKGIGEVTLNKNRSRIVL